MTHLRDADDADQLQQMLTFERMHYIRIAADDRHVMLTVKPRHEMAFEWAPHHRDWPIVCISRMRNHWRLSSGARFWAYDGISDAVFMRVLTALVKWRGNPLTEPGGWTRDRRRP